MLTDPLYHRYFVKEEFEMDAVDNSICGNAACTCPVVEAGTFCSDHCRSSSDEAGTAVCDCGHSSCGVGASLLAKRHAAVLLR
jgi:hypothetical protein